MTTKPTKSLNAQAMAGLLCRMTHMDMTTVAMVAGVQQKNMTAWLAGRRRALRLSSIVAILHAVGVKIDACCTVLDPYRVHFWDISIPMVGAARKGLDPLLQLGKLLGGAAVTEVRPSRKVWKWRDRLFRRYYLITGASSRGLPFKVVVCMRTWPWRRAGLTPAMIKGATWRDGRRRMTVRRAVWQGLVSKDMTVEEYAHAEIAPQFDWEHVSLIAREFGLTPDDIAEQILATQQDKARLATAAADQPDAAVPVRLLLVNHREAA